MKALLAVFWLIVLAGAAGAQQPSQPATTSAPLNVPSINLTGSCPLLVSGACAISWGVEGNSNFVPANNSGQNYAAGDYVTLNDPCATHAVLKILATVNGYTNGNITAATVRPGYGGVCATQPYGVIGQLSTTGSGFGSQWVLNWAPIPSYVDLTGACAVISGIYTCTDPVQRTSNIVQLGANGTGSAYTNGTTGTYTNVSDGTHTLQFALVTGYPVSIHCMVPYSASGTGLGALWKWAFTGTMTTFLSDLTYDATTATAGAANIVRAPLVTAVATAQPTTATNVNVANTTYVATFDVSAVVATAGTLTLTAEPNASGTLTIPLGAKCVQD